MSGADPTAEIWERRDRRSPAVATAAALTGLPTSLLSDAARVSLAASPEMAAVLDALDVLLRTMPVVVRDDVQRCVHEVRGPVVWSETLTARANALGAEDVFVCLTATRSFDHPANRLLVWVLRAAARAGRTVNGPLGKLMEPADRGAVAAVAEVAVRGLAHPHLEGVPAEEPSRRGLARLRNLRSHGEIRLLLAARERAHEPFVGVDLKGLSDDGARRFHRTVLACFDLAVSELGADPAVTHVGGGVRCGPVTFRHPGSPGTVPEGLSVEGQQVAVDDGAPWPRSRSTVAVAGPPGVIGLAGDQYCSISSSTLS